MYIRSIKKTFSSSAAISVVGVVGRLLLLLVLLLLRVGRGAHSGVVGRQVLRRVRLLPGGISLRRVGGGGGGRVPRLLRGVARLLRGVSRLLLHGVALLLGRRVSRLRLRLLLVLLLWLLLLEHLSLPPLPPLRQEAERAAAAADDAQQDQHHDDYHDADHNLHQPGKVEKCTIDIFKIRKIYESRPSVQKDT